MNKILDLFAGTGNISYEFISRGCQNVMAIEHDLKCIHFMQKIKDINILTTKFLIKFRIK